MNECASNGVEAACVGSARWRESGGNRTGSQRESGQNQRSIEILFARRYFIALISPNGIEKNRWKTACYDRFTRERFIHAQRRFQRPSPRLFRLVFAGGGFSPDSPAE